jgi:glyoxylase-like metal-dependent hydrolase (beta-lactamase superfamily II)
MNANFDPRVHTVFEPKTSTWQYIVADPETQHAVIIDSVLDFDSANNTITTTSADALLKIVETENYEVDYILETHAHADHLTASHYLQKALQSKGKSRAQIGIGRRITTVQKTFASRYGIPEREFANVFDKLFDDDEEFPVGHMRVRAIHLPGHTPDHIGYVIGSDIFTGDSIFNPDVGSARCDFPGGSAAQLYSSMQNLLSFPDHFKLYTGHDYPPSGQREPKPWVTVAEQKAGNKHVGNGTKEDVFVAWRAERDKTLSEPRLIHQALQVNIRGGRLPNKTSEGLRLLHVPVKVPENNVSRSLYMSLRALHVRRLILRR